MPTTNSGDQALAVQESTRRSLLDLFGNDRNKTERHIRLVVNFVQKETRLRSCTRESIEQAMIDAAKAGLDVGTFEKYAWIIPYGRDAQFRASYVGLVKALKETGACRSVFAEEWCQNDKMVGGWQTGKRPKHIIVDPNNRGPRKAVFAIALMTNGVEEYELMNLAELEQVRRSAAKDSPAWQLYPGQMVKKSVIRRLCNRLWGDVSGQLRPEQAERLRAVMEAENRDYQFENGQNHIDASSTTLDDLADEIPAHEPPRKAPPPPPQAKAAPKPEPPKPAPEEVVVEAEVVEVETPAAPQYLDDAAQIQLETYMLAGKIRPGEFPDAIKIATEGKTDRIEGILTADIDTVRSRIEQLVKDRRESAKKKGV